MSGLPNMKYQKIIAVAEPATAARFVLTAMTEMRRSVAPSVEPGLKPIQPNSRMNVPVTTKTMLCAGKARGLPSRPYLPMRGPRMMASAMAQKPPTACTTVEPAKSHVAVAEPMRRAQLRQPAAAPDPAAEDRIENRAHEELAEQERAEGDALADRADDDVAGRLHEHDLEQRERVDAGVVAGAAQEESLAAEEAPRAVAEQELIQGRRAAEVERRRVHRHRAELEGEAAPRSTRGTRRRRPRS